MNYNRDTLTHYHTEGTFKIFPEDFGEIEKAEKLLRGITVVNPLSSCINLPVRRIQGNSPAFQLRVQFEQETGDTSANIILVKPYVNKSFFEVSNLTGETGVLHDEPATFHKQFLEGISHQNGYEIGVDAVSDEHWPALAVAIDDLISYPTEYALKINKIWDEYNKYKKDALAEFKAGEMGVQELKDIFIKYNPRNDPFRCSRDCRK